MKTTKFFAVAISAGILTLSLASPSLAFAQSVAHPPKSHDARLQTKRLVLEESKVYSLQDVFNSSNLSVEEQEQITKDVLNFVEIEGNSMDRTIMRTVIRRLSPSEVKEIALSSDPAGTLVGMLPGIGNVYSALKYLSDDMYLTAARNGWRLEYVIAVDRDNPTSTGINFYWNYVK